MITADAAVAALVAEGFRREDVLATIDSLILAGLDLDQPEEGAIISEGEMGTLRDQLGTTVRNPGGHPSVAEDGASTAAHRVRRGGRPRVAEDGHTTRVSVTLPDTMVADLDQRAEVLGTNRSALIRIALAKSPAIITLEMETDANRDQLQSVLSAHGLDLDLQEGGRLGLWVRGGQALLLVAKDLQERGRTVFLEVSR